MNLGNLFQNARTIKECKAGETIFVEGQSSDVMYVIFEGEVDIQYHGRSIYTAGPGEILGEMAMIRCARSECECRGLKPLPIGRGG